MKFSLLFCLYFCINYLCVDGLSRQAFHVIWQIPSQNCQRAHINLSFTDILESSGITWNNGDAFSGDKSKIFYRNEFGFWPHYLHGKEPPLNGGIPQLGNLTAHLQKATVAIASALPDENFTGIACLNMEQFRPLWERNWGDKRVYQIKSRHLVEERLRYLNEDDEWMAEEAEKQFNYHARAFMTESLRVSRRLRPGGKWGYYHFPYCFNNNPVTLHCREVVRRGNDKMRWLWDESTAIFPSIYVFKESMTDYEIVKYMYANIEEGLRVSELVGGRPVYAYTKIKWNATVPVLFYRQISMLNGLRLPVEFGVDGVIIWGSQGDFLSTPDCHRAYHYLKSLVIPYTKSLVTFTEECSQKLCSNQGRCVHRGTQDDRFADEVLRTTMEALTDWTVDSRRYSCRCYTGYSGNDCRLTVSVAHRTTQTIFFNSIVISVVVSVRIMTIHVL